MGALLAMLRTRAHGINEIAADELFNYWVTVTQFEFGMPSLGLISAHPTPDDQPPGRRYNAGFPVAPFLTGGCP